MGQEVLIHIDDTWDKYFSTGDEDVKKEIVSHYLYLVNIVVRRLMPQYRDYSEKDELVSCGVLGLIDAVNKFDKSLGIQFQTYAISRIRGEIIDYMRKQDWAPTSLRKKLNDIQKAYEVLEISLNRAPSDQEIADYLNIKVSAVQKALQKMHIFNVVNFEAMLFEDEIEDLDVPSQDEPYQRIENETVASTLKSVVDSLPEKEKMVITLHYYEGLSMKSVAKILDISESRVSQIHSKTLMKMRGALSDIYY